MIRKFQNRTANSEKQPSKQSILPSEELAPDIHVQIILHSVKYLSQFMA